MGLLKGTLFRSKAGIARTTRWANLRQDNYIMILFYMYIIENKFDMYELILT